MSETAPDQGRNQVRNQIGPGPCTGACCDRFTLTLNGEYADLVTLAAHAEQGNPTAVVWLPLAFLHPPAPDDGAPIFGCHAWDRSTGRCQVYAVRPDACRRYPEGDPCQHCGARSGAEAAGVALMEVPRV